MKRAHMTTLSKCPVYIMLRNVRLLFKKPMRSTGGEQFSVYVYFKTSEDLTKPSIKSTQQDFEIDIQLEK